MPPDSMKTALREKAGAATLSGLFIVMKHDGPTCFRKILFSIEFYYSAKLNNLASIFTVITSPEQMSEGETADWAK